MMNNIAKSFDILVASLNVST